MTIETTIPNDTDRRIASQVYWNKNVQSHETLTAFGRYRWRVKEIGNPMYNSPLPGWIYVSNFLPREAAERLAKQKNKNSIYHHEAETAD